MNHTVRPLVSITLLASVLAGCSGTPAVVKTGDKVELGFTCRLPNGELAATTRPDDAFGDDKRSPYYLPRRGAETVSLTAGVNPVDLKKDRLSFEEEIIKRLNHAVVGLKEGEQVVRELQAERYPSVSPTDRFVRMATVRKRQKEMRLSREEYQNRSGKEPEVGQRFVIDPLVPGTVSEVTDKEVVVRFAPEQGKTLTSPFGPISVRETATHYELLIKAENNRPVRTGGMVGRIVEVTDESFKVDYGHPFGGETLRCDMTVAGVKPAEAKQAAPVVSENAVAAPEAVPAAPAGSTLDPEAEKVFSKGLANMLAMNSPAAVSGEEVRSGDLVTLNYTVTLEDGSLVATTRESAARDQAVKKVSWYRDEPAYAAVEAVAGRQEIMPGLGEALVGMKQGEKKRITLTPEQAFGMPDPAKSQQMPCSQTFPRVIRMPADEYVKRFSGFPMVNKEVELLPYFKSRVTEVTERDVALEYLVSDGASFGDSFGTVSVAVVGDRITTTLKPQVGAPFPLKDGFGIVSATDGLTFTVDFNHPLAGKSIVLELETVSIAPETAAAGAIEWNDNYDAGLARAKQEGKPVFLMLHADWCSWCKKSFSETFPDPRISALKDRFVWVRINSDKELKYKQQFGQDGFPMMVLLNSDGSVLKKIDGYRDARALREEIRAVLN
jgi:FKBP-type peptidyl-prolyl cis-trans isomerase 2